MSHEVNLFVYGAILNTKKNAPEYYKKCLEQRLSTGQGSTTEFDNIDKLEQCLLNANWEKYEHPNIAENCSAYITTSFGGFVGMIPINKLSDQLICSLIDFKGTGKLSLTCFTDSDKYPVDYNVLIVGDDGYGPCMFTFHPGEPLKPSTLSSDGNNEFGLKEGDTITVAQAKQYGFKYVKLQTAKPSKQGFTKVNLFTIFDYTKNLKGKRKEGSYEMVLGNRSYPPQ